VIPDPRFLFLARRYREVMARLAYGTASDRGFMAQIFMPSTPRAPAHDQKPSSPKFPSFTHEVGKNE
jgi:hypothetical protein